MLFFEFLNLITSKIFYRTRPEIKITDHDKDKEHRGDDDSDVETSPSSDEDDYPDQAISIIIIHKIKA